MESILITDYQLDGIEAGVPLCVGGPNLAIYQLGTAPQVPSWASTHCFVSAEEIAELRSGSSVELSPSITARLVH
jgi:hypothetical protein